MSAPLPLWRPCSTGRGCPRSVRTSSCRQACPLLSPGKFFVHTERQAGTLESHSGFWVSEFCKCSQDPQGSFHVSPGPSDMSHPQPSRGTATEQLGVRSLVEQSSVTSRWQSSMTVSKHLNLLSAECQSGVAPAP